VSYSDRLLSVVRLSVNFYIFNLFSRTTGPILTRLGTNHPWGEGILNSSNEGDCPSPRGDNHKRVKIHWKYLKIFSRTSRPISIKLSTNHPLRVKGILNCSNKGPGSLQRGDNHKNAKMGWGHFNIFFFQNHWARIDHIYMKAFWYNVDSELFTSESPGVGKGHNRENYIYKCLYWKKIFSRTSRPISIKLVTNHSWVKGILNCSNDGPSPFQRGDNHKNEVRSFINLFLQNHWARIGHIYMQTFWYNVDSELFTSWSPGVGRGHNRENHIYICLYWKQSSSPEPAGQFQSNLVQIILG
jgi:hypothetical protein